MNESWQRRLNGFLIATLVVVAWSTPHAQRSAGAAQPVRDPQVQGARPGPENERLRKREGTWDVTVEFRPTRTAQVFRSGGVQVNKMSLNGLWLVSDLTGTMGGRPFTGHAIAGYDPSVKRYVGVWIDSSRNYLTLVDGTYDESGRVFTTHSRERGARGRMQPSTQVTRTIDDNTEVTTLTAVDADGKEFTRMTSTYKRRQ